MGEREFECDQRAHRMPNHVPRLEPERVEYAAKLVRIVRELHVCGWPRRATMAQHIVSNNIEIIAQRFDLRCPNRGIHAHAVDQHERLAMARPEITCRARFSATKAMRNNAQLRHRW